MAERRLNDPRYRAAQLAARAAEAQRTKRLLSVVDRELALHARRLAAGIARLPSGQAGVDASLPIIAEMRVSLQRRLREVLRTGRDDAFEQVLGVWNEAGMQAGRAKNVPNALLGGISRPPISLLGAYENLGAAHWRTLLVTRVDTAVEEANHLVRQALLEGVSPPKLARQLRPYIQGAESFPELQRGLGVELKTFNDPLRREAARKLRVNTLRIAVSEVHNARAEAELQHSVFDPLVEMMAWRLAPDRGSQTDPDECDFLAAGDFFGLGEGVYPLHGVPTSPHPNDRCERVPIVRDVSQARNPKPLPGMRRGADSVHLSRAKFNRLGATRAAVARGRVQSLMQQTLANPVRQQIVQTIGGVQTGGASVF